MERLDPFQLDLLCAIVRLEQIEQELGENVPDGIGGHLLERVFTCDVPRLRSYLSDEALAFEAELEEEDERQRQGRG
jgi:hypothetical protein